MTGLNIINCRLQRILINDYEKDPDPDRWRTISGAKVQYLEMQSEIDSQNGWQLLGKNKTAIKSKLNSRFGCAKTQRSSHSYKLMSKIFFADVDSMTKSAEQKIIFDKENPYWKNFFRDRK